MKTGARGTVLGILILNIACAHRSAGERRPTAEGYRSHLQLSSDTVVLSGVQPRQAIGVPAMVVADLASISFDIRSATGLQADLKISLYVALDQNGQIQHIGGAPGY